MSLPAHDGQFAKVLVEGNEDSTLPMCQGQNLVIAGISRPVSRPDNIVPRGFQRMNGTTPDTGIEQKFHEADSSGSGSIRS